MVIFGTALLAACYLAGIFIGELIAVLIGVKADVGEVGIAMMLLIAAQHFTQPGSCSQLCLHPLGRSAFRGIGCRKFGFLEGLLLT